jgi:hypothetical protein
VSRPEAAALQQDLEDSVAAGATRVGWGAKLSGHEFDLADWKGALKQPFDPWVMETGNRIIFRSSQLDSATTSSDACERAKIHHNAGIVRVETIEQIMSDGRRNVFVQVVGTAKVRARVGAVGVAIARATSQRLRHRPSPATPKTVIAWSRASTMVAFKLLTRTGLDWTAKYPSTIAALANLKVKTAYLDGKLCGVDQSGLPSFARTQAATDGESGARLVYYAFDLLHLDSQDVSTLPLIARHSSRR